MAESPEHKTLIFCADEFKRLLTRKQKNHTLEDVLIKFIDQADHSAHCDPIYSQVELEGPGYLLRSITELVRNHPQKYHELLKDLEVKMAEGKKALAVCRDSPGCEWNSTIVKDVPALEALYRSLSRTYCEFQMSQMYDHNMIRS